MYPIRQGVFDISKLERKIVYKLTKKPECYVHVDEPITFQEKRQVQYNNWCKRYEVYNGSYLPKDPNKLLDKGWEEITNIKNTSGKRKFKRKSSGQTVRYDPEKPDQYHHYHWNNPNPTKKGHKMMTEYIDRYGKPCTIRDGKHHLAPLDEDYVDKRKELCKKKKNHI